LLRSEASQGIVMLNKVKHLDEVHRAALRNIEILPAVRMTRLYSG
jgi:hypothetical protein